MVAREAIEEEYLSEERLNQASISLEATWSNALVEAGQDAEEAKTEAAKIVSKVERQLAVRLEEVPGAAAPSREKQRVIVYYKPKPGKDFDSLLSTIDKEIGGRRGGGVESTGGSLELTEEEFTEAFSLIENSADLNAEGLIGQLEREGGEVVEHLRLSDAVVARLNAEQIRELSKRDDVERVEIDKPIFTELNESANTLRVNQARAQGLVAEGRGIVVAVLDGEVGRHPDLEGRIVQKRNYTQEGWGRASRHGTHVGGIIAGNGGQYRGMAPQAIIWNYKLFPTGGTESRESAALEAQEGSTGADAIEDAVKDGAKVINCSWGISGTDLMGNSIWALAAERAAKLGVVMVKSAGNSGPGAGSLTTPADARGDVIVVGAVSRSGTEVTSFSSRGPTGDGRNKPDICAPGERIMSASDTGNGYRALSGTSMAAPHISGLAALLLERNRNWKGADIKKALMDTADPLTAGDTIADAQGRGLVNMVKATGGTSSSGSPGSGTPASPSETEAASVAQALEALRRDVAALRQEVGEIKMSVGRKR